IQIVKPCRREFSGRQCKGRQSHRVKRGGAAVGVERHIRRRRVAVQVSARIKAVILSVKLDQIVPVHSSVAAWDSVVGTSYAVKIDVLSIRKTGQQLHTNHVANSSLHKFIMLLSCSSDSVFSKERAAAH